MAAKRRAKRALSASPRKKRKGNDLADDSDPDDLQDILAQIKAQEASEALAQQLQSEWNQSGPSSNPVVGGTEPPEVENDEAMARRLALEWTDESLDDRPSVTPASTTGTRTNTVLNASFHLKSGSISPPSIISDSNDLPGLGLNAHRPLFTSIRECSNCGADVESPLSFVTFSTSVPPPSLLLAMHAPCSSCSTNHCRGCFKQLTCPKTCRGKGACVVEFCCAEVRAVALFETLSGFDRQILGEQETSASRAQAALDKVRKSTVSTVGPGGTGYGTGQRGGGSSSYSKAPPKSDAYAAHWDELVVRALRTLVHFLPSPYSESAQMYDMLPHASLKDLLLLSQLPELLGGLLRNDSVTDWISRAEVYNTMLDLLRRLADSELTVDVLIGQRWSKEKSPGLGEWMWDQAEIQWSRTKDGAVERSPPLYEYFQKLTRQCEAFLAGAVGLLDGSGDDEVEETTVKGTSLCGDIIAARTDIERVMDVLGKSALGQGNNGKGKGRDIAVDLENTYSAACERHAFRHILFGTVGKVNKKDGYIYPGYAYASEVEKTASSTRNPKDRLHLVKELAVMATCLPVGVWMRVDEVRNDAIKIMIAGPEGTPYSGGLFEFDCFMPLEYPHKPPLMHLRTTGGGTVRFNPNLYDNGKVCLSLLGTWPGNPEEQWAPSRSTLLQVLVSIQSMIFVEAPYFNEPGFGTVNVDNKSSIAYNKNITLQTTRWAIVDWLKPQHRKGIWADVIKSHCSIRHHKIRKCIQEWAKIEPGITPYLASFDEGIREIQNWEEVDGESLC